MNLRGPRFAPHPGQRLFFKKNTWAENERCPISTKVSEHLSVAEELSEVDVEEVAALLDHDVVVVPVADAQHVRDDRVSGARVREVVDGRCELQLQIVK
jgi:hypothetical protein